MHSLTMKLTAGPMCHARPAERLVASTDETLKAIARGCLERMLGHPLTHEDTALLPGIDISALLPDPQGRSVRRDRSRDQLHGMPTTSGA